MASASLLQLLDDAIGTPEVNINLEALRKLLKVMLGHLSLLGLRDELPQEGAQEAVPAPAAPVPRESHPAGSYPGLQEQEEEEEDRTGAEAGAQGTGQRPQEPGQPPPGKDQLQGTRSGPPVTSVAAEMGQMEKSEAKEVTAPSHEKMGGMKAMESSMGEEIQRIKEVFCQATNLCKDLREEVDEVKATQSRMGEGIRMIQEVLGQGNLQDASGQSLVLPDQSTPAKPQTSDMDKLGWSPSTQSTTPGMQTGPPSTQSTTPGIQTGTPSAPSGPTGAQPGSQAGHPAVESITSDLSELQGQVSLQSLARDLQGEKEKIRQLEDALGKLSVTAAKCEVDGTSQIPLHLESALQEIKQEQKELREEQKTTKASLKQLVTTNQLQEELNELRAMMGSAGQEQAESQAPCPDRSSNTKIVRKLLHRFEKLQEQVDSLMPQQVQRSLPQKSQHDEELLKSIQATVVRVEGDCEQLGYITGSLRDDHRQHQKDIEALFRSLEGLEKKADKEDLLMLKVDKAALGSKVSCTQFDASMEQLEDRMQELLRRMSDQEQRWQESQQQLRDALDSKLDRLELGPFQKQLEDTWGRIIEHLKEELSVEVDDAAGIKQQLLVPYKCLSCDRHLNMQVPGPHIDTLPLYLPLPSSHAAHPTPISTEQQAQQHSHRKLAKGKFHLKSQSCRGQDTSNAQLKDVLWLSKKPGVTELLSTDDCINQDQERRPEVAKRARDELGPTTSLKHRPGSDPNH